MNTLYLKQQQKKNLSTNPLLLRLAALYKTSKKSWTFISNKILTICLWLDVFYGFEAYY